MSAVRDQELPWLRLYTDLMDDDKVLLLCEIDRYRYVELLMMKRKGILDSTAPKREARIAAKMRIDEQQLHTSMQHMIDVGLIDTSWQPIAWRKRQFPEAMSGAERMRRHRDRQRDGESDETVTPPSPSVTQSDVLDLDIETESEKESDSDTPRTVAGSAEGAAPKRAAPRRATKRMPSTYSPSAELQLWARTECPGVEFEKELAGLRDYEFRTAHTDWDATVRNWMRRAQKQLGRIFPNGNGVGRESKFNRMQRRQDEI